VAFQYNQKTVRARLDGYGVLVISNRDGLK